jgi:lysyl-tRNA synthetase class 2
MELTEQLFAELNTAFLPADTISWHGQNLSLRPPFRRLRYLDALSAAAGLSMDRLWDEKDVHRHMQGLVPAEEMPPTYGKMLDWMFDHYVKDSLQEPVFVTHFPKVISPLSKTARSDPRETERFELYIAGMEIANGFSELNDPFDQRQRFEAQMQERARGDEEAQPIDQPFLQALEQGMAPAAGEGIGIDRLVMLYTGADSIKEVILFPLLRPKE